MAEGSEPDPAPASDRLPPSSRQTKGRLFVISGPSGAGKSSVVAGLRQRRPFYFSVSATTRPPRSGEVNAVHYLFVTPKEFKELIARGDLLEWAEFNGRFYGTPRRQVLEHLEAGDDVLLEIELQGARQIRKAHPDATMFFIMTPRLSDLERRLRNRGDTSESDIQRRLAIARKEIEEASKLFDHVVVNDDLERCIDEVDHLMGTKSKDGGRKAEA